VRILRLDPEDDHAIRSCFEVRQAMVAADDPFEPPQSERVFRSSLFAGWSGAPIQSWYIPDEGTGDQQTGDQETGTVAAWYRAEFPDLDNRHWSFIDIYVHPRQRRAGLGTVLLRHAAEQAAAEGRRLLGSGVREGGAGEAFAAHVGATFGKADVRRVQHLRKVPADTLATLRETATKAAAGYSLVQWEGVVPDQFLDQYAAIQNALNDAPHDPGVEPHMWDARQIRERHDARIRAQGRRRYSVAAMHDATGEMAALSAVGVDPALPEWGQQAVTMVTRPHRGHRLGLLVKVAMLSWLTEAEPQLEKIATWNAVSNQYMIGINEALGYEVAGRPYRFAELPVASVRQS
jgi:GNAT superfamily N-acetyltransferase